MNNDLVSREALRKRMYHEVFDNGMGKWESGLWIRYKLFEKVIEETPAVDAVEVVRCKDCRHWITESNDDWCEYTGCDINLDGFCEDGERRDDDE